MISNDYLAGFFDADGSVGIYNRTKTSYQVNISIANSGHHGRIICNEIKNRFGGSVVEAKSKKSTHRNVFWWRCSSTPKVKEFLEEITPHLIIKKDQALATLEFVDRYSKMDLVKTPEDLEYAESMVKLVKEMKVKC